MSGPVGAGAGSAVPVGAGSEGAARDGELDAGVVDGLGCCVDSPASGEVLAGVEAVDGDVPPDESSAGPSAEGCAGLALGGGGHRGGGAGAGLATAGVRRPVGADRVAGGGTGVGRPADLGDLLAGGGPVCGLVGAGDGQADPGGGAEQDDRAGHHATTGGQGGDQADGGAWSTMTHEVFRDVADKVSSPGRARADAGRP